MISVSGSPAERTSLSECLLCVVFTCSQSLFLYRCSHGALSEWVALVQIAGPHVFVSCPCLMTMH